MKKLSLNEYGSQRVSVMDFEPSCLFYYNDVSSYRDEELNIIPGFCVNCAEKPCMAYTKEEAMPEFFSAFPHNTDFRVCPTKAIVIDKSTGLPSINENCISCGLCIYRCPFAAIQFSLDGKGCFINHESPHKVDGSKAQQERQAVRNNGLEKIIVYNPISIEFSSYYTNALKNAAKRFPDLSEVIVRNSLINFGNRCATNAPGNNHIRIEFFAESKNKYIIGESEITDTDTLAVTRRILDDLAVLISRYNVEKEKIMPLAVINGFPNKRTDYYSVVEDIKKILDVQVNSLSYHILFVLNLYNIKLTDEELSRFILDRKQNNLLEQVTIYIPKIKEIDQNIHTNCYEPQK